ncbi:MAG: zinc ABC transporter substrate-binding protein, partial [Leptolyngbyaceae bacterium]|nr:zinc ABC transporter substrate-binding protein [Leptolyngbyaceae bacterium]
KAIEDAQLIFYFGYDFEPSLIKLIQAPTNSATKVAVGEVAVPNPILSEDGHSHGHSHDHSHDHGHDHSHDHDPDQKDSKGEKQAEGKQPDPHVWHDAQNGIQMVKVIQNHLTKAAPTQTDLYAKNAQTLTTELAQIDGWIKSQIATIPSAARRLVTTHGALGYYSAAYGIPVEGALQGLSTKEKPTAARIKELTEVIKADRVPTIFAEVSTNPKLITTVAKEANVKLSEQALFADGLGEPGSEGDTYPKMLIANTKAIVEGLGGQYVAFQIK